MRYRLVGGPDIWDSLLVPSSRVTNPHIMNYLILEDGTKKLSQNAGNHIPTRGM